MRNEGEVIDRQITNQRLDIGVVLTVLAARLCDGGNVCDESAEIIAYTVGFAVEKSQLSDISDVGKIR